MRFVKSAKSSGTDSHGFSTTIDDLMRFMGSAPIVNPDDIFPKWAMSAKIHAELDGASGDRFWELIGSIAQVERINKIAVKVVRFQQGVRSVEIMVKAIESTFDLNRMPTIDPVATIQVPTPIWQ